MCGSGGLIEDSREAFPFFCLSADSTALADLGIFQIEIALPYDRGSSPCCEMSCCLLGCKVVV